MLGKICVLVLIDKHIPEKLLIMPALVRMVAKQHIGVEQQIIEIHRPRHTAAVPVTTIYLTSARTPCISVSPLQVTVKGIVLR